MYEVAIFAMVCGRLYDWPYLAPLALSHIDVKSLEIKINLDFLLLFLVFLPFLFPLFLHPPFPFGFVVWLYRMDCF